MDQPVSESLEGIDTSLSSTARPQVLCIHDKQATDYVRIIMESGMNLPMGEDRSAPLITEVSSLFFFLLILAYSF